ncbi:MAG: nicotinate phosphoribosyltransferase [Faecousia sp.]
MPANEKLNMTMLCDFYELTMGNGYLESNLQDRITYFDVFYRKCPDGGGFAIAAGLEQIVEYIQDLHFTKEDIDYLRGRNMFSEAFLEYLANFRFTGDIWAVPEGTPVFPKEPILTVRAPAIQAQLIETYVLLCINHQSLIATKANRVVRAADGRTVLEFGSRRAQGADGAIHGARAAYIGGCHGTACTISDQMFGVPAGGTMAHAWVQMFDTEYEAFKTYCQIYPDNATLLVDTYNTLHSGVPNAIRAFNEVLKPLGITKCGIRLDSGDMAYLTQKAREMLDDAGWTECKISVSNSLDEYIIQDILRQGARIDLFGVGERLITARSEPVFGGVYKLVAVEDEEGKVIPKIKISENVGKITNPHYKKLYRFYGNDTGKAIADYLCVYDEVVDDSKDMMIFDPDATWKTKTVYNFTAKELQVPIFRNGELVYKCPTLPEIRKYCMEQVDTLWDEVKRFDNPHTYYVDLSQKLWDIKYGLLKNGNAHGE